MSNTPFLTLALCAIAIVLHLLPEHHAATLFFDIKQLQDGNALGLIFGHWVHADIDHLAWNVTALALLGGMLEQESRRLLVAALLVGTVFVDLLLLSPAASIERYCGLSGILNTVLACLLYRLWQRTRSAIVPVVACLSVAKIALEIAIQQSLFTDISWPPYAPAHLAGMLGALFMAVILHRNQRYQAITQRSEA